MSFLTILHGSSMSVRPIRCSTRGAMTNKKRIFCATQKMRFVTTIWGVSLMPRSGQISSKALLCIKLFSLKIEKSPNFSELCQALGDTQHWNFNVSVRSFNVSVRGFNVSPQIRKLWWIFNVPKFQCPPPLCQTLLSPPHLYTMSCTSTTINCW